MHEFLTKRWNRLLSCIDWLWLMGWLQAVFAAAALATRIVSAERCPPQFPVSQHQIAGGWEAFKANITGNSNPREARRVSATHIAIRPSWECAVFAPDKPLQVRCQEGFLALTSPSRSWRSQTVTVSCHTAAIMLPFVLQQFCVRWALNPVSAHPPCCLKKKMKIDLCSLFSSNKYVLPGTWSACGYWATIFPELLLLPHIFHLNRIFELPHSPCRVQ